MGCSSSSPVITEESREIDKRLKRDNESASRQVKLLLLGTADSGKSTLVKQMKLLFLNGFSAEEMQMYAACVRLTIVNLVVRGLRKAGDAIEWGPLTELVRKWSRREAPLAPETWRAELGAIAECPQFRTLVVTYRDSLGDNAEYWLGRLPELLKDGYVPSSHDVLNLRVVTTAITETRFVVQDVHFRMVDVGGQRNERRKWIHCFEDMTALIFLTAVHEYDLMLTEDESVNRMHESLKLFDDLVNSEWFRDLPVLLFLNKIDLLRAKLESGVHPGVLFSDYKGGTNYDKALDFIEKKFRTLAKHREPGKLFAHATCAVDTDQIRVVFLATRKIVLDSILGQLQVISPRPLPEDSAQSLERVGGGVGWMQRPPSRVFALGARVYAQYHEDNLWYTCCVKSYNPQLDMYGVEFEVFKNTQTCHASQLYPILDEPQAVAVSNHNSPLVASAEGAEGALVEAGAKRSDSGTVVSGAGVGSGVGGSDGKRLEKLQKLSSIEKQKVDHSRQLRKISSYESDKMNAFRREERLNAMSRFALPSQKTGRLLALRQMGPSRVAAFPDMEGGNNNNNNNNQSSTSNSSDQDSESSSSYNALGKTLDELIASGKTAETISAGGSIRKRLSVLFKPKASEIFEDAKVPRGSHESSSDSSAEENLESSVFLDVPVSGTRSLRIKARKGPVAASEIFEKEEAKERRVSSPDLRELLSGFHPRNASLKELKVKKGSESLLNLVRLSRQHHTLIEDAALADSDSSAPGSVELLVGNRCAEAASPGNIVWTLFVEELHATASCIDSVSFGPLPPGGDVVVLNAAPFCVSRESPLLFVESMDFQLKVAVKFAGGREAAVFHHDLNVPGSWSHCEADRVLGTVRQISVHTAADQAQQQQPLLLQQQQQQQHQPPPSPQEPPASPSLSQRPESIKEGSSRSVMLPDNATLEAKVRATMEKEMLAGAEEILRYAERIGREILVQPLKRSRNPSYCMNALRCRVRAFLVRGAVARGVVKESVSREGDEQALIGETVNLAVEVSQLASDQIQGSQFVSSMAVVLCSTFHSVKSLILAAKIVQECLEKWTANVRPGSKAGSSVKPFVSTVEDFRSKMEVTVRHPPPVFDEEELATRLAAEMRKRDEMATKRKALVANKHRGLIFEKLVQDDEEALLATPPPQRPGFAQSSPVAKSSPPRTGENDDAVPSDELKNSPPRASAFADFGEQQPLVDMPGNPLMGRGALLGSPRRSPGGSGAETTTAPSSSSSSPELDFSIALEVFKPVDFLEVSRARTEDALMRTSVANYFKSLAQHEGRVKEGIVRELFSILANPLVASTIIQMPNFKKSVQRVRTVLKLIHVAATVVKMYIRNIGRAIFHRPQSAANCLSVLFESLLPLQNPLEGDAQLQIMHETIRMSHFCDVMELLRMFFREPLLRFLSDSRVTIVGVSFHPVTLLTGRLEHDGVNSLFLSLLGAELVMPRKVWFSDKGDIISVLLGKMVVSDDALDAGAENASHVLKKIVSSLDHVGLNQRLIELHKLMFRQTFGPCTEPTDAEFGVWNIKQFRFTIRVLSDWALMTLGRFRAVEERWHQECVATVVSFLPIVKDMLLRSFPPETEGAARRVGFVRLELVNYLAALINARCVKVDDALLQLDIIPAVVDVFFNTNNSSMLHSSITEFILVPICEDQTNRLLAGAIEKGRLLERVMEQYVNVAEEGPEGAAPRQINGFLTLVALAVSKSGAADRYPGWDEFVLSKLLPVIRLQQQRGMLVPEESKPDEKTERLID